MKNPTLLKSAVIAFAAFFVAVSAGISKAQENGLTPAEQLGKSIFFDENLSINRNQSCAACHAPEAGWTGPLMDLNSGGSVY